MMSMQHLSLLVIGLTVAAPLIGVRGQYRDITGLPIYLRSLKHCPAPGYYGDPNNCKKFYRCVDYGIPNYPMLLRHDFNCAPGTVFDETLSVCNHPSKVRLTSECHLKYAGGRVVPTVPPLQGIENNNIYDVPGAGNTQNDYVPYILIPHEADMLIRTRINEFPTRKWANNYIVTNRGPIIHLQVQVPYTTMSK